MSDEKIDVLYNEILNLPKVERPMTATTQCEINVNDLFDTIRAFRKIPDYNELIKDNRKKQQEIERLTISLQAQEELTMNWYNKVKKARDLFYEKCRISQNGAYMFNEVDYEELSNILGSEKE